MSLSVHEFIRCAKAIFAFGAGYKAGERYALGEAEAARAKRIDAEAWQLGYDLSNRRYMGADKQSFSQD
jgi:hypothetical protein